MSFQGYVKHKHRTNGHDFERYWRHLM